MLLQATRREFLAACAAPAGASSATGGAAALFAERRQQLAESVGRGVICLLGHDVRSGQSGFTGFRQESNFLYLTGHGEPGAALLLAPRNGGDPYREILFLPPHDAFRERWSGPALRPQDAEGLGIGEVLDAGRLPGEITALARDRGRLWGLRSRDGEAGRLAELAGTSDVRDVRDEIAALRCIKSPQEIALLRAAARITEDAFRSAWATLAGGVSERSLAGALVAAAFSAGCERLAFPPTVASGPNATILHYQRNRSPLGDGELVLMDAGVEWHRYAADVARCVPVNGRFSPRQRQLNDLVLRAQKAVISAARPGVLLHGSGSRSLRSVAERVLRSGAPAGVETHLPHAVGHHVGLDVHDPAPARGALREGMVVAIEPGVYLPAEGLGIRIEDVIEVTAGGARLLGSGLPASADEIESALEAL